MPIRPEYKWFYPVDWPQLSAMIRFERAKGRCEECGRPHGCEIQHLGDGRWWDEEGQTWRNGRGRPSPRLALVVDAVPVRKTKVVLATAHLDHDPINNRPRNLKALCQRCHMIHDRPEHRRRRCLTLRMRKVIGDQRQIASVGLFLRPERDRLCKTPVATRDSDRWRTAHPTDHQAQCRGAPQPRRRIQANRREFFSEDE